MKYLLLPALIIFFSSCKKSFLELTDTNSLNRQTYVKDLKTLEHYVNGIYIMLDRDFMRSPAGLYADLVSDNLKPGDIPFMVNHYSWAQIAENKTENSLDQQSTAMNGEWLSSYTDIRSCNFVIENVDRYRSENPAKADNLKGQAYSIRAMIYLKLMGIFAQPYTFTPDASHPGIPYITTSDITAPYQRNSVAQNFESLISDLTEAIKLMPSVSSIDSRFMNQLAAKCLLARTYLYKNDFVKAGNTAREVTSQVPLMQIQEGYPDALYKFNAEAKTECLFQLSPIDITSDNAAVSTLFPSVFLRFNVMYATNDIVDILLEDPADKRAGWISQTGTSWTVVKFPESVTAKHSIPGADYYQCILRSSEMFLTIAEVAARSGDDVEARQYLNAIRTRANPSIKPVTASGAALLNTIIKERRKEFCFENMRMFDLQRLQLGVHRKDAPVPGAKDLPWSSNKAISPIPVQDVKLAGINQNSDY